MSTDLVTLLASTALGGGGLAAITSLYVARKKVPAERDSIAVGGAETAVLALERSLAAETKRADRAEAENIRLQSEIARRDARIAALERKLDEAQESLNSVRAELHELVTDINRARGQ